MLGLAKVASDYSSREDQLIDNIHNSGAKRYSAEASIDPAIQSEMSSAHGKHMLVGTGIGGLAGAALGGIAAEHGAGALAGALAGGLTGLAIGAITGSVKADSILMQKDPHLYNEIQKAKAEEYLSHLALEQHHELHAMYARPQQHQVYHYNQGN